MWLKLPDFVLACSFVVFSLLLRFFPQNLRKLWKITNNWFVFFFLRLKSLQFIRIDVVAVHGQPKNGYPVFLLLWLFLLVERIDSAAIIRYYLITSNIMNISNVVQKRKTKTYYFFINILWYPYRIIEVVEDAATTIAEVMVDNLADFKDIGYMILINSL